jgi:hypothetical protein
VGFEQAKLSVSGCVWPPAKGVCVWVWVFCAAVCGLLPLSRALVIDALLRGQASAPLCLEALVECVVCSCVIFLCVEWKKE